MLCSFRARAVDAHRFNDGAERYKDALEPAQGALTVVGRLHLMPVPPVRF